MSTSAVKQPISSAPGPCDTKRRPRRKAAEKCMEKIAEELEMVSKMTEQQRIEYGVEMDSDDEEFKEGDKLFSDEETSMDTDSDISDDDDDDDDFDDDDDN